MSDEIDIVSWMIPNAFCAFAGLAWTLIGVASLGESGNWMLPVGLSALAVSAAIYWRIRRQTRLLLIKQRLLGRPYPPKVPENRTVRM
jgi:hypothetical protein